MASLFDDLEDDESSWQEVPAARFLSWPLAQQYVYCAARDADSACYANSPEEIEWFLERSKHYKEMSRESA